MLKRMFAMLTGDSESVRQRLELMKMGDHELADLGISRDQIDEFVRQHAGNDE